MTSTSALFSELSIGGMHFPNRIVVPVSGMDPSVRRIRSRVDLMFGVT